MTATMPFSLGVTLIYFSDLTVRWRGWRRAPLRIRRPALARPFHSPFVHDSGQGRAGIRHCGNGATPPESRCSGKILLVVLPSAADRASCRSPVSPPFSLSSVASSAHLPMIEAGSTDREYYPRCVEDAIICVATCILQRLKSRDPALKRFPLAKLKHTNSHFG